MNQPQPPDGFDMPHPATAYQQQPPQVVYRPSYGPAVGQPDPMHQQPPGYPPPRPIQQFSAVLCTPPNPSAQERYDAAIAAAPAVLSAPGNAQPVMSAEAAYTKLPQDRYYQFKMWLQSPEGQNYTAWEQEARALLSVIEPFNMRWTAGWMTAELELLRPLYEWLQVFDGYTRQRLTYADHNPAARFSLEVGQQDPNNPIPYDVLAQRLAERDPYEQRYTEYEAFWGTTFNLPFASGWLTSWAPGENDPMLVAPHLRALIDQVTSRLWSEGQLPAIPSVPAFAPSVAALPRNMTALMQQMIQAGGGEELAVVTLPEPFEPPAYPTAMPGGPTRWLRGRFLPGRAVVVSGRQQWAEGVALTIGTSIQVQRFDGSVGEFPVNDVRGAR